MQLRMRRSYPHDEEEGVISLESSTRALMAQLMMEEDGLRVVSIVGMGSLSKTTLAKKLYNHVEMKKHFDCYAWSFISQQCMTREVLRGILLKVSPPTDHQRVSMDNLTEDKLVERLHDVLKQKRYLVVLDDIWTGEAWDCLKHAFPKGKKGSKVLFTTRNTRVALDADPRSSPLELPFLTEEEGWQLLFSKVCVMDGASVDMYSPEFEKLGRDVVRKCGGLPLAITLPGGLLTEKNSVNKWKVVERNINRYLNKFPQSHYATMNWILALSYDELPFQLKPCFLYLSNFPEDWQIPKKQLVWMWMAEFVTQLRGEEMILEDVAEECLEELISRSLVRVGKRDHTGRRVKTCHVHDLVREMRQKKAQEENFCDVFNPQESHSFLSSATFVTQRISVHPGFIDPKRYESFIQRSPKLRCLLHFTPCWREAVATRKREKLIYNTCKLLRVLDLHRPSSAKLALPGAIGNLIHLRYLRLKGAWVVLPSAIGNLQSLQTLDVRGCLSQARITTAFSKLKCLRHLLLGQLALFHAYYICTNTSAHLETLKFIQAKSIIRSHGVLEFNNLQHLGTVFRNSEEAQVIMQSPIIKSGRLRSLTMSVVKPHGFAELEPLSHCHDLSPLTLNGEIPENMHPSLHNVEYPPANLAKVTLRSAKLERDPMAMLEKLRHLRFLSLAWGSYRGTTMVCSAGGFPQLQCLTLEILLELEEW